MIHHDGGGDVTHGTEGEHPALMAGDGVMALDVGHNTEVMAFVLHTGKGYGLARLCIGNGSRQHLLGKGSEK